MRSRGNRTEAEQLMDWLVEHAEKVHYPVGDVRVEQVHDIETVAEVHRRVSRPKGWTVDCSQIVQAILTACGFRNPSGPGVDGYTGSFLTQLTHYHDARLQLPCGISVYGGGTGHHATICRHADRVHGNPIQFSHGKESDPRYVALLTEDAGQPGPFTLLSINGL